MLKNWRDTIYEWLRICDCNQPATWIYVPSDSGGGNSCYCDECVPRGCSCTEEDIRPYNFSTPDIYAGDQWNMPPDGSRVKWLNDMVWCFVDEKGRKEPCCEFWKL